MRINYDAVCDIGCVRTNNEDMILVDVISSVTNPLQVNRLSTSTAASVPLSPRHGRL